MHRAKHVQDTLAEDDLVAEMFKEGKKQAKLLEKKKLKAQKDKAGIDKAMKELSDKGEAIAQGKFDSARCPMCTEKLIINTNEKKEMSVFGTNKCNLPFIFHVSEKVPTMARYAKRMDPDYQKDKIPICFCGDKVRLVKCQSTTHKSINKKLFYMCKKKQQDGPCAFGVFLEKLKPEHQDRRGLLTATFINRNKIIIRESKANLEAAQSTYQEAYDKEPVGEIDWSEFDLPESDEEVEEEQEVV